MAEQHKSRGVDPCGWEALAKIVSKHIMPDIHQKSHMHSRKLKMIHALRMWKVPTASINSLQSFTSMFSYLIAILAFPRF